MTREEAIRCLSVHSSTNGSGLCTDKQHYEAKQMAINALEQEPCEDEYIKVPKKALKYRTAGMVAYNVEWLKNHFDIEQAVICGAQEPQPKIGRWIAYEVRLPDRTILNYRCSVCGRKLIGCNTETLSEAPFCHCGAKMVEPQESEDKE